MRRKLVHAPLIVLLAATVSAAAAQPAAPAKDSSAKPQRQCFWGHNVTGWADQDDRTVNLRVGVKDVYQLKLMGSCPDIRWNQSIALVAQGGSDWICSDLDAEIVTRSSIGRQRCPATQLRKLTPSEVAALPKNAVP